MANLSRFDFSVVRTLRMKRGLTADRLAKTAGLTRATIMKIEGGDGNPTLDTIESLSLVFNLSSSELIRLAEVAQCEQGTLNTFKKEGINVFYTWFPDFEICHVRAENGGFSWPAVSLDERWCSERENEEAYDGGGNRGIALRTMSA